MCNNFRFLIVFLTVLTTCPVSAQKEEGRLSLGGCGDAVYVRNFYSDNPGRYDNPEKYRDDSSHGRFDIPHSILFLQYKFNEGWTFHTKVVFEHTGTASHLTLNDKGEWEKEVERGGEVALGEFWLQKTFSEAASIRAGYFIVPVGHFNVNHEPTRYFTVLKPEGESSVIPGAWHDIGVSFAGRHGDFGYCMQFIAGLDAMRFGSGSWIKGGGASPFAFKVANKYGVAARIDNYSVPGLCMSLSGYAGRSVNNSYPGDVADDDIKGTVLVGAFDFEYDRYNWIIRGNADYGYLSDASAINEIKTTLSDIKGMPVNPSPVGKNAFALGIEAGYDVLSNVEMVKRKKLYVFGRYEYYDTFIAPAGYENSEASRRTRIAAGLNFCPIPQIVIKAEFSDRLMRGDIKDEKSLGFGIAYETRFL